MSYFSLSEIVAFRYCGDSRTKGFLQQLHKERKRKRGLGGREERESNLVYFVPGSFLLLMAIAVFFFSA